jgi:PTS system nitrogen regulatory IIA component
MLVNFRRAVKAGFAACWQRARRRLPLPQSGRAPNVSGPKSPLASSLHKKCAFRFQAMADSDFDIDRLAAYLHRMPSEVQKLAERGKLPGRRVGGAWRFSAAEIHHWMEERIGLSDDEELTSVEGALDRAGGHDDSDEISIAELLRPEAVAMPLLAKTRGSVISQMCELAAATHLLWDVDAMADAVRAREAMHSTALDNGVALLHPRRPMANILAEAVLALGITPGGIPFRVDGKLTDVFFLICSTSDHEHLRILARLSRVINDSEFLAGLRAAPSAATARELVVARDNSIRIAGSK